MRFKKGPLQLDLKSEDEEEEQKSFAAPPASKP
jgi:hypothetical protein